eukprot:8175783-Pyramimonas_sp.AAC.2
MVGTATRYKCDAKRVVTPLYILLVCAGAQRRGDGHHGDGRHEDEPRVRGLRHLVHGGPGAGRRGVSASGAGGGHGG